MNTSLDRDTVMTVDYGTTCNEYTDIKWQDVDMGSYRGEYFCLNPYGYSPNAICYAARIRLDPGVINQGSNDEENRKKTACHEVGHSVGLQHGNTKTDCMLNGDVPDTSAQWRTFNQHHIGDHIDPEYG